MRHLIISREYPPCNYEQGGIGAYAQHIAHALAERGETVHVIGERWQGAPKRHEAQVDGRLIVHRVAPGDHELYPTLAQGAAAAREEVDAMLRSPFPEQWFSWVAAGLAERLVELEGIEAIEGQEWEGPLYYFLLRRSLGLGPARRPPCIVHLHSPTEFIFRANDYSVSQVPHYLPLKRMEDFVIRAADALLCPSAYLARQVEARFGLRQGAVEIIPLPIGVNPHLERAPGAWTEGSICYFGRLEPRKGVIDWVDAAVTVARQRPTPLFEFVGKDLPFTTRATVRRLLEARIPADLRPRFVFHASRPRAEAVAMLAGAQMVVVPSRWENFPNTCLEAMASGAPVLASRNGGMAEMVVDGETGWLAPDGPEPLSDRLAATLHRALDTPAPRRRQMGEAAERRIRDLCDAAKVTDAHLAFRTRLLQAQGVVSPGLPEAMPWPERRERPRPAPAASEPPRSIGVAVLLHGAGAGTILRTLAALAEQSAPAEVVVLAGEAPELVWAPKAAGGLRVARLGAPSRASARQAVLDAFGPQADAWIFLNAGDALDPNALWSLRGALAACPSAGIACGWRRDESGRLAAVEPNAPSFPFHWIQTEALGRAMFRTEALRAAGDLPCAGGGLEDWSWASLLMAQGWAAVRVPAAIASCAPEIATAPRLAQTALMERFPDLLGLDAAALIPFATPEPSVPLSDRRDGDRLRMWVGRARKALRDPGLAARRIFRALPWRVRRAAYVLQGALQRA